MASGDRGQVGAGFQPDRVQQCGPRGPAGLQRGDDRGRPAGHHLVLAQAPAKGMAEGAVRGGVGVRPQPRGYVDRQHQPTVAGSGKRDTGQCSPQPGDVDPVVVDCGVQGSVPAPMLGSERQVHEGTDWTVGTQQGVAQLEQGVAPDGQTRVQLRAEPSHHRQGVSFNLLLDPSHDPGLRSALALSTGSTRGPSHGW